MLSREMLALRAILRLLLVCCQLGACKETLLLRVLQLQAELHGVEPVRKLILEAVYSRKPCQPPADADALCGTDLCSIYHLIRVDRRCHHLSRHMGIP